MRNQKDNHLRIERNNHGWNAFLINPEGEVILLGSAGELGELVENCELNSTFDRDIETLL